jgi:2'-5' RNA ligase
MTRLFVAVRPSPSARRAIAAALDAHLGGRSDGAWGPEKASGVVPGTQRPAPHADVDAPRRPGLRWVPSDQWHVTVRFLGDVADVGAVADALGALTSRWSESLPVTARAGPATTWWAPSGVLVVPVAGVERLAARVAAALATWAPDDGRAFVGHLTLARRRGRPTRPDRAGESGPGAWGGVPVSVEWPVDAVELVASTLGHGPAVHRLVGAFPLGGVGGVGGVGGPGGTSTGPCTNTCS